MSSEVAVLGVGMHPWGKWGQSFVGYGVKAAQAALKDAGMRLIVISGRLVAGFAATSIALPWDDVLLVEPALIAWIGHLDASGAMTLDFNVRALALCREALHHHRADDVADPVSNRRRRVLAGFLQDAILSTI